MGATNTGGSRGSDVPWETEASIPKQRGSAGQYPAATNLLPLGKIRSKKQLVHPYLHDMNSPALQWIPLQAHRPGRKSSK